MFLLELGCIALCFFLAEGKARVFVSINTLMFNNCKKRQVISEIRI